LPVEIFTFADELNDKQRNVLEQIDHAHVRLMNTSESLRDRNVTRYAIKLHAILQSTFEHVLWLDADNIVVHDPNYLFDLPHYTRSSAIFWPDFWSSSNENPICKILNLTCRAEDYEQRVW
jgi:alpha 1,2-mannosyltransferase